MAVCGRPRDEDPELTTPQTRHDRDAWCGKHGIALGQPCNKAFADLDARFDSDWETERRSAIADLPKLDLSASDLRHAIGPNVTLVGAKLGGARLEGAYLPGARLEGANLIGARLEGAYLPGARLEGAYLVGARLEGAHIRGARLEGANLLGARLERANLVEARLEGANLRGARLEGAYLLGAGLEGADLGEARLEGANLRGAWLEGANLRYVDFRNSNWAGASNRGSPAEFADFRGAQALTQAQLDQMIGNAGTLLPTVPDGEEPLYVWSCWETAPEGFDALVARVAAQAFGNAEAIRAEFLCGPDNPRRKTGTPLPLDAPYPPGHPLAGR